MRYLHIFTDGSVNTQTKVGYGAYLVVSDLSASVDSLKDSLAVKRFEHTNSTKLELQTLLWSISEAIALAKADDITFKIYTDSQNIVGLPRRRARLEQNDYFSNKNRRLINFELYREFYQLTDRIKCEIVKVAGHLSFGKKEKIDMLFSLVDKTSRRKLRESFKTNS